MDAETKAALLTLAKAILNFSEEAATVHSGYDGDTASTGVWFHDRNDVVELVKKLETPSPASSTSRVGEG